MTGPNNKPPRISLAEQLADIANGVTDKQASGETPHSAPQPPVIEQPSAAPTATPKLKPIIRPVSQANQARPVRRVEQLAAPQALPSSSMNQPTPYYPQVHPGAQEMTPYEAEKIRLEQQREDRAHKEKQDREDKLASQRAARNLGLLALGLVFLIGAGGVATGMIPLNRPAASTEISQSPLAAAPSISLSLSPKPSASPTVSATPTISKSAAPSKTASVSPKPSPTSTILAGANGLKVPCIEAVDVGVTTYTPIAFNIAGLPQPASIFNKPINVPVDTQAFHQNVSGTAVIEACITDASAITRNNDMSLASAKDILMGDDSKVQLVLNTNGLKAELSADDAAVLGTSIVVGEKQPVIDAKHLTGVAAFIKRALMKKAKPSDPDQEYDLDLKALQAAQAAQAPLLGQYAMNEVRALLDSPTYATQIRTLVNQKLTAIIPGLIAKSYHSDPTKVSLSFGDATTQKPLPILAVPFAKLPAVPTFQTASPVKGAKPVQTPYFVFNGVQTAATLTPTLKS